jgi:hypothetical protein
MPLMGRQRQRLYFGLGCSGCWCIHALQGSIAEEEGEDRQASDTLDEQARRPRQLQRLWIVQQYCNRGTMYDAIDR